MKKTASTRPAALHLLSSSSFSPAWSDWKASSCLKCFALLSSFVSYRIFRRLKVVSFHVDLNYSLRVITVYNCFSFCSRNSPHIRFDAVISFTGTSSDQKKVPAKTGTLNLKFDCFWSFSWQKHQGCRRISRLQNFDTAWLYFELKLIGLKYIKW